MLVRGCWKMGWTPLVIRLKLYRNAALALGWASSFKPCPYTDKDLVLFSYKINTNIEGCVERVPIVYQG